MFTFMLLWKSLYSHPFCFGSEQTSKKKDKRQSLARLHEGGNCQSKAILRSKYLVTNFKGFFFFFYPISSTLGCLEASSESDQLLLYHVYVNYSHPTPEQKETHKIIWCDFFILTEVASVAQREWKVILLYWVCFLKHSVQINFSSTNYSFSLDFWVFDLSYSLSLV